MKKQMNKKLNKALIILIYILFILNLCSCNANQDITSDVEKESTTKAMLDFNSPSLQEELNLKVTDDESEEEEETIEDETEAVIINYLNMPIIRGKEDMYFLDMEKAFLPGETLYEDFYKEYILELLRQMAEKFCNSKKESDIVLFIAPNKTSCYRDMLGKKHYDLKNEGLPSKISDFIDYIRSNSDIKVVYPIDELTKARKDGQVYYRLDSHWTDFGAHVGAASLIEALGGKVWDYKERGVYENVLYNSEADCIPNPRPENFNIEDKICGILGLTNRAKDNGFVARKFETQVYGEKVIDGYSLDPKDDRRLIMMDDSMGYGMIRTIFPYFRDVTFLQYNSVPNADPKYLTGADIFVVEIVERNIIQLMNNLIELLNKDMTNHKNNLGQISTTSSAIKVGPVSEVGPTSEVDPTSEAGLASKLGPAGELGLLDDNGRLKPNMINTIH